jgi:hypothetical protein
LSYILDGTVWNVFITTATNSGGGCSVVWYPPYPNAYEIKASWSGNANYAGATSPLASLSVTGTASAQVTLLVLGAPSVARGGTVTFDVLVTNPGSSLTTTLYIEVAGPNRYRYLDTLQVTATAGSTARLQFVWQAPSTSGTYQVLVGLIPPKPTSMSQTQITVT